MAKAPAKIAFNAAQEIPYDKLFLSTNNVRRVKAKVSINDLKEDIAYRGLIQGLSVRPELGDDDKPTGRYAVQGGGRRYTAIGLLVAEKRWAKNQPIPCMLNTVGSEGEVSLAENIHQEPLHPLDQYRAFAALQAEGMSVSDIAARFFVSTKIVEQRLRLSAVSPILLQIYAEDGMQLDQLMAFTVTSDHRRQEEVWATLVRTHSTYAWNIRSALTKKAVPGHDRRAQFVGAEAYEAAGGTVIRDLFHHDHGGYFEDPGLLDRLATAKLQAIAEGLGAQGWKWVDFAVQYPHGHTVGLRQLRGRPGELTEEQTARMVELKAQLEQLDAELEEQAQQADDPDDFASPVEDQIAPLSAELDRLHNPPQQFEPAEVARAGVFVSISEGGDLRVQPGYVRPDDEPAEPESAPAEDASAALAGGAENADDVSQSEAAPVPPQVAVITIGGRALDASSEPEEDATVRPLSDRLVTELGADRTLAMQDALAQNHRVAMTALLHALCLAAFYHERSRTCLQISLAKPYFTEQSPNLESTPYAKSTSERHQALKFALPEQSEELWHHLEALDDDARTGLLSHCVALSIDAVDRRNYADGHRLAHADTLASALDLDMAQAGWKATVTNYLSRVPKARIIEAVTEAKGKGCADLIAHLKKGDMAREAERLMSDAAWVPEPLRTMDIPGPADQQEVVEPSSDLPEFLEPVQEPAAGDTDGGEAPAIAA